jgi:uncharacterized membrane protein required for colicin V production
MNLIDGVICVCLVYNGFVGLKKGFVRIVLDLTTLIISTAVAILYYGKLSGYIGVWLPKWLQYSDLISFGLLWFILFGLGSTLAVFLSSILDKTLILGPLDRLLGACIGLLKGLVFLLPLLLPLYFLKTPGFEQSTFAKPLKPILKWVSGAVHMDKS